MPEDRLSAHEIYRIALDTRNLEIGLFWQRSNYFLALNTALAIGFFGIKHSVGYPLLIGTLGVTTSYLWYRVNLGSKFWQSRWEHRLRIVEESIGTDLKFFAADWPTIHHDVNQSLQNAKHKWFRKQIDKQILKKPSVSHNMTLLSLAFLAAWLILTGTQLLRITMISR